MYYNFIRISHHLERLTFMTELATAYFVWPFGSKHRLFPQPIRLRWLWLFLLFRFRRERNSVTYARRAAFSDSNVSILASKTMTKSFSTFMSYDNSMNRICSVKQIYTDLGWVPTFLLKIYNTGQGSATLCHIGILMNGIHMQESFSKSPYHFSR